MDGLDQPEALAISPDGRDVYVASKADDAVVQIRRDTVTGALTPGMRADDNDAPDGPDTCVLLDERDGRHAGRRRAVRTGQASTRSATTTTRSSPSSATPRAARSRQRRASTTTTPARGPDICGASTYTVSSAENPVVSPDGNSVYLVAFLLGDQAVTRFDRSPSGALTPAGCITNTSNGDPACTQTIASFVAVQGLAIAPDGTALYAAAAGNDAVSTLRRGPSGSIAPAGCVQDASASTTCTRKFNGLDLVRDVAISPDGARRLRDGRR